jgi:hypothetical protein
MKWTAFAAALVLVLGATWSLADKDKPPAPTEGKHQCPALTGQDIKTMLENLGYEAADIKDKEGNLIGGSVKQDNGTYSYTVSVAHSVNKEWVWVSIGLGPLPDPKIPADIGTKLLQANASMGVARFAHYTQGNSLSLATPMLNKGIKPADLSKVMRDLDGNMLRHREVWDSRLWPGAKKPDKDKKDGEKDK